MSETSDAAYREQAEALIADLRARVSHYEALVVHAREQGTTEASDHAATICVCGRLIIRHLRGNEWWHSNASVQIDHRATPRRADETERRRMTAPECAGCPFPDQVAALELVRLRDQRRDLTSRLGFGDGITEPMADNDTIVEFVDQVLMEASEHHECPIVCELCGERLADTICEHCYGSGGNNALNQATLAYSECEWCAGAGKVHVGCAERSYADLALELVRLREGIGRLADDLAEYNPGFGDYARAAHLVRALLDDNQGERS